MKTSDFDYKLPPERIAQIPIEPRHASRLLVLDRNRPDLQHKTFWNISDYLRPHDVLVINQTRVIPGRLNAHKSTGGKVEILLLRPVGDTTWQALIGGKNVRPGARLQVENGPAAHVLSPESGLIRLVSFDQPIQSMLENVGKIPLPPYIHVPLSDQERYQTVYASETGSAAAPTAGLHFTVELMKYLEEHGISFARVTLHVGLDTFAPVTEREIEEHVIHSEWCELSQETAQAINTAAAAGGRVIAIGTTSVRTLETAASTARSGEKVGIFQGPTKLFITPGFHFQAVDGLVTNFHLPRSTLLMLVSAFAGREKILDAYRKAIEMNYRFYSFGDAMLLL